MADETANLKQYATLADMFRDRITATPDREAYFAPERSGVWKTWTWRDVGQRVRAITAALRDLGLRAGDRAAVFSSTRLEWIFADTATVCAGGATVTVYPSSTDEEAAYILNDSGSVIVFAETADHVALLQKRREELSDIRCVITFDGHESEDGWVVTLGGLEERGRKLDEEAPQAWDETIDAIGNDDLAMLIYTSGTTGKPKGVMLTHDNWCYQGWAIGTIGVLGPEEKHFLWLPLSHSFGKLLSVAVVQLAVPTAVDGRVDKVIDNLAVVQPTVMGAPPRIFEKVYNVVVSGAQASGGLKLRIFQWALAVGLEVSRLKQAGREPGPMLSLKSRVADELVFSKLRTRFGGRIRCFISGAAPLNRDMAEFFHAAGMLILEGYGLTESSAAAYVNREDSFAFGTVGFPMPETEMKLAESDGEILLRGRHIMKGYWNLPEVTKETLDDEGWLYTGDIGEEDDRGRLKITDRKKDLIKTSGGKYVAPQKLEGRLKALTPLISQVVVHGNHRNFCSALITLDEDNIAKWAEEHGLGSRSYADLAAANEVHQAIQPFIDQLNSELSSYETIKKFALLPKDFTVEDGLLTPSLKVKRKAVETTYKDRLDAFYEGSLAAV